MALPETFDTIIRRWLPYLMSGLLVIIGVSVYSNSLSGAFVLDDHSSIVNNQAIRHFYPWGQLWHSGSRPLLTITLAANYAFDGLNPTWYHVFNIAVHVTAGLLLFGLIRQTLMSPRIAERYRESADELSFVIALIWLVHPLQTQAVTYTVQRCESMMGLCFIACLYCYARSHESPRPWLWQAAIIVAFLFGLASKEIMLTVLPVLWLYHRTFFSTELVVTRSTRRTYWGWGVAALVAVAFGVWWIWPVLFRADTAGFGTQGVNAWEYLRSQPGVLLHYLRLSFWPDSLCLDYGWPVETRLWTGVVLPGAAILLLLVVSIIAYFRWPPLGFIGLSFFLILAPTSSFIPIQDLAFEHRMYLPLAAVVTLAVLFGHWLIERLPRSSQRIAAFAIVMVLSATLAERTIARNEDYRSSVAMWQDIFTKISRRNRPATNIGRVLANLGMELHESGKRDEALEVFQEGLRLAPEATLLRANLVRALIDRGEYSTAQQHVDFLLMKEPNNSRFWQQAGLIAVHTSRNEAAENYFRQAIDRNPNDPTFHTNLGQLHAQQGKWEEAIACFEQALQLDSRFHEARRRLIAACANRGDLDLACELSEELCNYLPDDAGAHLLRAKVYIQAEKNSDAVEALRSCIDVQADNAEAYYELGNLMRRERNTAEAIRCFKRAVEIDPRLALAHNNLGGLLVAESPRQAAFHFEAATLIEPRYIEARYNWAISLMQLGQFDRAVQELSVVLQQQPGFAPAEATLREARFVLERKAAQRTVAGP